MDHEPQHHAQVAGNNLDKLAQLVGQDRALQAVKLVDEIKENLQALVDAVPVQVDVDGEIEQLKQALLNRDAEIATLKGELDICDGEEEEFRKEIAGLKEFQSVATVEIKTLISEKAELIEQLATAGRQAEIDDGHVDPSDPNVTNTSPAAKTKGSAKGLEGVL